MAKAQKKVALGPFLTHCRGAMVCLCLLALTESMFQVAMALLSRYVIDAAINDPHGLPLWGGLLVADVLLLVLNHAGASWFAGRTYDRAVMEIRGSLLRSAAYSQDLRLQQFHSGQLLSRAVEDANTVCDGLVSALPQLVGQLSRLLLSFGAVALIAPKVSLVLAAAAVAVVVLTAMIRPVLKKHHRHVREQDEKLMAAMQEDLQQLELIQSLDIQEKTLARFRGVQLKSLAAKIRRRVWTVGAGSILNVASLTGSAALLLWGALQVARQVISYGSLTSLLQLLALFRGPALSLSGLWTRLAGVEVAAERLLPLLEYQEPAGSVPAATVHSIVFENVTFSYPGDETPVLDGFNGEFPVDGWACLTGISGKGKSTLFKLILGLYIPQKGRVFLRTDRGEVACSPETRKLFAYVPQDFALFSGTVRENMLLVCDGDDEALAQALKVAQADFIWEMTAGEDTPVGENNTGLSKGQLQRLAIARAILMERPILLLDECTSALDSQTEAAVLKGLHTMGKQAILVTHRPDALQDLPNITHISI